MQKSPEFKETKTLQTLSLLGAKQFVNKFFHCILFIILSNLNSVWPEETKDSFEKKDSTVPQKTDEEDYKTVYQKYEEAKSKLDESRKKKFKKLQEQNQEFFFDHQFRFMFFIEREEQSIENIFGEKTKNERLYTYPLIFNRPTPDNLSLILSYFNKEQKVGFEYNLINSGKLNEEVLYSFLDRSLQRYSEKNSLKEHWLSAYKVFEIHPKVYTGPSFGFISSYTEYYTSRIQGLNLSRSSDRYSGNGLNPGIRTKIRLFSNLHLDIDISKFWIFSKANSSRSFYQDGSYYEGKIDSRYGFTGDVTVAANTHQISGYRILAILDLFLDEDIGFNIGYQYQERRSMLLNYSPPELYPLSNLLSLGSSRTTTSELRNAYDLQSIVFWNLYNQEQSKPSIQYLNQYYVGLSKYY